LALVALLVPWGFQAAFAMGPAFQRVGNESGPPPAVITSLYQDRAGFVWIGSRDGLTLYDGHSFVVFEQDASDPESLSGNTIRTIYEDRDGNLWFGTNTGGLNLLDRSSWTFKHFRHDSADPQSISHDSIYAILHDQDGFLWVGTQRGLNRFDMETGEFQRFFADPDDPGSLSNDYVMTLLQDRTGRLWVGTLGGGLNLWHPENETFTAYRHDPEESDSLKVDEISALLENGSGQLWVGTIDGLDLFDPLEGSFRRVAEGPGGLADPLVTSLAHGSPGKVWIGTHGGGLHQLDVASGRMRGWQHEPARRESLSEDVIIALLVDDAGSLWIGTWGGGLNRLSSTALLFADLTHEEFLPAEVPDTDITAMTHDRSGGTWVGTRTGYVVRSDAVQRRSRTYLRGGDEGTARIIQGLHEDREGALWIATNVALLKLDPATGRLQEMRHDPTDPNSLGPGYVRSVLQDRAGRIWVGTGEGGLQRLDTDGSVAERFLHDPKDPESLSDNYVTTVLEDSRGTLWVGTRSGGLNALDPETRRAVRYLPDPDDERSLSHHYVTSMLEDSTGRLWVATSGGVNLVEAREGGRVRFRRFTEGEGLIDNNVMGLLEDTDRTLWISTKRGLSRFDPTNRLFASIYVSDGLPTAEFEPGSAARTRDKVCFGSVKGVVAIPVGTPFPPPTPSPIVVTSLRSAGEEIRGDRPAWELGNLRVPYGEWLSIELAVLDYSPERRHHYAYRIGDEWVDLGSRREITFSGLTPGLHEFSARGRNSQGVWSTPTPALHIEVVPPFWMTRWFRGLMLLLLVAVAIAIHQGRLAVVERRNRELVELHRQREKAQTDLSAAYERLRRLTRRLEAAKEDERQHIARELHDDMGPTLTAVIINLQLLSKTPDPAERTRKIEDAVELVDRLVQRVRDLSLDLRPPLLEELGLLPALKGYLEAQSARTGLKIVVEGKVSELNGETEIVAFRLVQEAVTNVIRHAGATRVDVSVRQMGAALDLFIKDDGRGFDVRDTMDRAASGKGLGLPGMQERVQILGGEFEIRSIEGSGTEITVRLPLEVAA
jgi:ligand-binding sensor domain-containing protein/signal transduction histidine kinase